MALESQRVQFPRETPTSYMEIIGSSWEFSIFFPSAWLLIRIELSRKTGYVKKFASTVWGI